MSMVHMLTRMVLVGFITWFGCAPADEPAVETGLQSFYVELQADVATWGYTNGEWTEDFGDGAAFGAMYFSNVSQTSGSPSDLTFANETRDYNLSVVMEAGQDPAWALENLEEVFMACQGLIEYAGIFDDQEAIGHLDTLIDDVMEPVVTGFDDYVDASIGDFAADLYGPTAITAGIAVIYTQYALRLKNDQTQTRLTRAAELLDTIHEQAWDKAGNRYLFKPGVERLFLYPNGTMLIALNRLYGLTGEARFLERAKLTFQGIAPLKKALGYYQSPYSQEYQGAQTDEYGTLSAQNYLSIGLLLLYENTGDKTYLNEVVAMMHFVKERLYDRANHKILHHWIDGRWALESDPDYFCSGCNLQVLYILWYLKHQVGIDLETATA